MLLALTDSASASPLARPIAPTSNAAVILGFMAQEMEPSRRDNAPGSAFLLVQETDATHCERWWAMEDSDLPAFST